MTLPGEIDTDGWRKPKKPRALTMYHLAKAGLKPREIAKIIGLKSGSVRFMLHCMRHPQITPHGYFFQRQPKSSKRQHNFTGKHAQRHRQFRDRLVPVSEREQKAYNGSRYA